MAIVIERYPTRPASVEIVSRLHRLEEEVGNVDRCLVLNARGAITKRNRLYIGKLCVISLNWFGMFLSFIGQGYCASSHFVIISNVI